MLRTGVEQIPGILAARSVRQPSGCLVWTAARDWDGYGMLRVGGKQRRAHRLAWEVANGASVPPGLVVRHACDNPPCIEPSHLLLGSLRDNAQDRERRGRSADRRGEKCPTAKLRTDQVLQICGLLTDGISHTAIAQRFGVTREAITSIARGRNWRSVTGIQRAC